MPMIQRIFIGLFLLTSALIKAQTDFVYSRVYIVEEKPARTYQAQVDVNINAAFSGLMPRSMYSSNKLTLTYKNIFKNKHVVYMFFTRNFDEPQHSRSMSSSTVYHDSLNRYNRRVYRVRPGFTAGIGYQYLFKPWHRFQHGPGASINYTQYNMYYYSRSDYSYINTGAPYAESRTSRDYSYEGIGLTLNYTLQYFIYKGFGVSGVLGYTATRYMQYNVGGAYNAGTVYRYGPRQLYGDVNLFLRF